MWGHYTYILACTVTIGVLIIILTFVFLTAFTLGIRAMHFYRIQQDPLRTFKKEQTLGDVIREGDEQNRLDQGWVN